MKDCSGVQIGVDVYVPNLACSNDTVLPSSNYKEMQGLIEATNRHAVTVNMQVNAPKTKLMSALIPDKERQAVVLDDKPLHKRTEH